MAYIEEANELMTDATGQSIATAIGNMSATSVGNLAALQTTDKTSLVGAVNEVKSGLTGLIVIATKTITIDSDGDGSLDMTKLDGQLISASATGVIVTPWVHSGDYEWYVRVIKANGEPFSGQAMITYAYTPRNQ